MPPTIFSDTKFPVKFQSDLGSDLFVSSMTGEEQLSGLFVFHLELVSEKDDLQFDDVVGLKVTTILELLNGQRFFNGYITEFSYVGTYDDFTRYRATVRPWFWFLTRTADCRIFQNMKVPDIIKQVFRDNDMTDFEERLSGQYRQWENCVQYRESDFNFIARLMEQEGIYFYFEHQADKHVLVMADDIAAHQVFPDFEKVPFHATFSSVNEDYADHLDSWTANQYIVPDKYAVRDFNFKTPKLKLLAKIKDKTAHESPLPDAEIYDYPGEYMESESGKSYAKIRMQELQCKKEIVHASGTSRGMSPGCFFTLEDHPRDDQNKQYLVISVNHHIDNSQFVTGKTVKKDLYRCNLEVIDKTKPYRATRKTPKPLVQGPQTAIVVGRAGDEIYTDEYGRVKVQFHWDRYGESDQHSSCWVRVSQLWAGAKWGGIHIPRIGQEVIVSFMEGDPDRPIITGRVYNADNMQPHELEQNKTQSGIKSHSTPGGGPDNFNEIRMEDKYEEEELYIQAEKDENILVKNNKDETVGNNETISIGHDREESVGNDETISVGKDRKESVGHDEDLSVSNNRTRNVGVNESITVGGSRVHEVAKNETITIGDDQNTNVGKNQAIGVDNNRAIDVKNDQAVSIGGSETREVGKKLVIDAGVSLLLKCGDASILLKNGDIKIDGKNLILNASGKASIKSSGPLKVKGSTISEN